MKIFIIYQTQDVPTGGGNQFLKALSTVLSAQGALATDPSQADAFLCNSHHCMENVIRLKLAYPSTPFFHRIDGPMRVYNTQDDRRDDQVYWINKKIADGTIFQSEWSKRKNLDAGMQASPFSTVVFNAPDPEIFNRTSTREALTDPLPNLVATSWSNNMNKGFKIYRFLDEHYVGKDFNLTFIGRSPIPFKNIIHLPPLPSRELAQELHKHDIFITASQADTCSNSLTEALHCGLPSIVKNDGGHPEIIGQAGLVFDQPEQIPDRVNRIARNYATFQAAIALPDIDKIARLYLDFISKTSSQLPASRVKKIHPNDFTVKEKLRKKNSHWKNIPFFKKNLTSDTAKLRTT
jgi:glycosyltransferase involved in cell wall biosynthesis